MKKIITIISASIILVLGILCFIESIMCFNDLYSLDDAAMRVKVDYSLFGSFLIFFFIAAIIIFTLAFVFLFKKQNEKKAIEMIFIGLGSFALALTVCGFARYDLAIITKNLKAGIDLSFAIIALLSGIGLIMAGITPLTHKVKRIAGISGLGLFIVMNVLNCFVVAGGFVVPVITIAFAFLVAIGCGYLLIKDKEQQKE